MLASDVLKRFLLLGVDVAEAKVAAIPTDTGMVQRSMSKRVRTLCVCVYVCVLGLCHAAWSHVSHTMHFRGYHGKDQCISPREHEAACA